MLLVEQNATLGLEGPRWLTAADEDGRRRLENNNDFVRVEIASGIKQRKRVMPVLVNNAKHLRDTDLPDELSHLLPVMPHASHTRGSAPTSPA